MKKQILVVLLFLMTLSLQAQKYFTKTGHINFYSHTIIEDITADNNSVTSVMDSETGQIEFKMKMTDFVFEKKLMQEHFNENYVESEKYPTSTFKGKIEDVSAVDFKKRGVYKVKVSGEMTIHGVSKPYSADGTIEVMAGGLLAKSEFLLNPEDFGIEIPSLVREKIANDLSIKVDMKYLPLENK
ncbi:MAG: YceI family protein [Bacteroidota bacterium]